jgi:superfamily II DNA helicase RecQ
MSKKSEEILSNYWGYSKFRPLQEEIVDAAIYGKDVFAFKFQELHVKGSPLLFLL